MKGEIEFMTRSIVDAHPYLMKEYWTMLKTRFVPVDDTQCLIFLSSFLPFQHSCHNKL